MPVPFYVVIAALKNLAKKSLTYKYNEKYKHFEHLNKPEVVQAVKDLVVKLGADKTVVSSGCRTPEEQNDLRAKYPSLPLPENDQHCKCNAADVDFF